MSDFVTPQSSQGTVAQTETPAEKIPQQRQARRSQPQQQQVTPVNSQEAGEGDDGHDADDVYHPRSAGNYTVHKPLLDFTVC